MQDQSTTVSIEDQLQSLEKEITEKYAQRKELLKQMAGETVEDYPLKAQGGATVTLSEMFGDKTELLVVHNMGKNCPYCTLWADGFNGVANHLADRAAFAVVSPNSPEVQKEFAESRNWGFPMFSSEGSTFSRDMGYEVDHEGKPYQLPGVSAFVKNEDGTITRTSRDFFGPGDVYAGIWHLLELLPNGANGWHPRFSYENN